MFVKQFILVYDIFCYCSRRDGEYLGHYFCSFIFIDILCLMVLIYYNILFYFHY